LVVLIFKMDQMEATALAVERLDRRNNGPPVPYRGEHSDAGTD
jgi:hypothetical protein